MSPWWLLLIVPAAMWLGAALLVRFVNHETESTVGRWFGW